MNDYNFGNFLCMLRVKNGMTQADIANKLGVTPAAVSKWENGSSKPRVEVLFQLAQLLTVAAVFVGFIALVAGVTLFSLAVSRNTEVYKVAYDYFIESQTFQNLGVDESKIWHNRYSGAARVDPDGGGVTQTVEIGFVVKGKAYLVVCHGQNDLWFVCEECTGFH